MSRTFYHFSFLYQNKKKEQLIYTDNPSGSFDLQRLIAGKPAWRQANYAHEAVRRKLIIHDWTFFNYTVIQKKDFYLLVEDLLEDGFEIYLWTGEIVKEITKENWYQYRWDPESYLRNSFSKYSPSAHIKKWAIDQLSWAEDDLFILDDYWLPVLRDNLTELPPRHLLISDLAQYSDAEEIISSALGLTPKIEHVILDEISTDSIEFYLKMQRYIESLGIKIIVHYKKLDIDTRALEILLQNDALYLGDHLIKKTDLYDIESVDLDSDEEFCLNHAELDELFSLMPKLKRVMNLVLNETILLNPIPHLEFLEVTQGQLFQELWGDPLKMLYLSHEGISDSIMISNLKNLSYLKESNTDFISDLTALKNLWHVSSSCFEYVEGVFFESAACINLGEIKLSDYNNPALLSYSSNLKKLTIETLPLIISHPIPTLEILCVKNITYAQLTEISRNFPNLKKLALSEIVTEYEANSIITSLNTLEILEIEGEISFDIATTLLQNAPNLQKLLIQCHEFIFENKTINLPKLEQITFKGNKSFLYLILKNAANIKQIQLNSISDSPRNDVTLDQVFVDNLHIKSMLTDTELVEILHVIKPNHLHLELNDGLNDNLVNLPLFSHLKSLSLIGYSAERYLVNTCFISNKLLNNLLLQTPRLKKLRLKSIQIEDKIFLSPTLSLPFLVDLEINLEKTSISLEDINLFGKIAPNLKVCKLDNAQQLFGRIISNHSLNNLEYLEIKSANLSGRDIENLLMSCPKLTKLILPGLKLTDDLLTEPFMSGVNELVLNQSLLSNTQLVQLLGYFPNLKRLLLRCCEHLVAETIRPFLEDIPIIDLFGAKETEYRTSENTHSQWCDFNTNLPSTTLSAKRYFYSLSSSVADPDTRFYRLQVFNQLKVNSEATRSDQLLQLTNQGDPQWRAVNDVKSHKMDDFINYAKEEAEIDQDSYHFFGQVFIELTSDWQALPSLSPFEVLTDIAFASEIPCDINYSLRDNLYYIRSTEGTVRTKICYTVRIPCAYPNVIMPQALQDDINYLLQFNVGELRNIPQNANAINYLNLLWEQGIGACRHRSMLFLWRHAQDVRSIYNDGHAFVEVKIGGFWIMVNLGGYPAQLQIIDEFIAPTVSLNLHEERQQGEDPQIAIYATRLEPWRVQSSSWSNWNDFADEVVHPGQKILLEVNSPAELNPVWEALAHYCGINNLPYHYVANPDDLVCSLPYLAPREGLHKIQPGPGGVLYDFFMACNNAQLPGILIINYERFGIDDLIRTNTILDPERQIDGVLLPKSLIVIGIRNNARPDVYEGADFISRWDQRVQIPQALILNSIPPAAVMASPSCTLDLWDDPEAMELLLGRWRMMGAGFIYEDGLLNAAVAAGHRVLALRQAPPAVRALSHQISTLGWVVHNGKRLEFPQGLQFQWTEGYDWPRLRTALTWLKTPQTGALVLNPTLYPTFFKRYREDTAAQQLQTTPGWVEQATGQKLAVTLSRSLTEGQWAQLLHLCCLHQVSLQVFCPPSVSVPEVLGPQPQLNVPLVIPNTTVVISSERDTTVLKLLEQHPQARFADVSECTASDLWQHWQSRLDPENYCLRIWHEPGWVYQALSAGETVILTGTFRAEVQDALQGAWCGPDSEHWLGQLFLVTEQDTDFPLLAQQIHTVSPEEKKERLQTRFSAALCAYITPQQWLQESLSRLQARLRLLQRSPEASSDDAWLGLEHIKPRWDENADSQSVVARRKAALEAIWATSPYVCIVGLTGGGKTTFISKIIADEYTQVYYGEEQQEAWAQATGSQRQVLCLDEGNLSIRQRSELEGLCLGVLGMPWGSHYYPLTARHRVVVLMNPQAEGGLRQLPSLFLRHGNTLVFDPLPPAFIAEEVIKPLVGTVPEVAAAFLAVYRFACLHSTTRILMTPRDIAMMAALYLSYKPRPEERLQVAQYVAYQIGKAVLPPALHADLLGQFSTVPQSLGLDYLAGNRLTEYGFTLTPSRLPLVVHLEELFAIRELRRQHPTWQSRGLGGLVVESAPGLGKSELMRAFVRSQGLVLWQPQVLSIPPENAYVILPASLPPAEKKSWLLQAFHAGAVVLMDELNSGPVVEDLLNALLSGETLDKEPPKRAGFLLLATQNPPTMAGRVRHTSAIERRLLHAKLEEYPQQEVEHILRMQGLSLEKAKALSTAFVRKRQEGTSKGYATLPTLRDVMNIAQEPHAHKRLAEAAPENEPLPKRSRQYGFFGESEPEEGMKGSESLSKQLNI